MSIASGVTMPEVYVLEHEDGINAFAAGNSPADAAIAVTRGAATRLKREELQGVIAHEFSHILNGDMRLNVRLLGWTFGLLAVAIVARVVLQSSPGIGRPEPQGWRGRAHARGAGGDGPGLHRRVLRAPAAGGGVAAPRAARRCVGRAVHAQSRSGLSGALLKIAGASAGSRLVTPEAEEVAHMLFAAGLPRLFATHPPIEERLKALDPSFRASELPKLAAEAARDSERQRADDAARPPGIRAGRRERERIRARR